MVARPTEVVALCRICEHKKSLGLGLENSQPVGLGIPLADYLESRGIPTLITSFVDRRSWQIKLTKLSRFFLCC